MKVKEIIAKQLKIDESDITDDSQIKYELGIDSLDIMMIISEIEKEYKINIDIIELENIETIKDIEELINKKMGR